MKAILILIFGLSLYANSLYETKLYKQVFTMLFGKKNINIYTNEVNEQLFKNSKKIKIVKDCNDADIVFLNIDTKCNEKPLFVKDYDSFKNTKNVIGAFYYRKGRPQLKLRKKDINKFGLNLDNQLKAYLE